MFKVKTEFHTSYIPNEDITIIWQDMYVLSHGKVIDHIQRECVGWHYGEPCPEDDKHYSNMPLTAQFIYD